MQGTDVYAVLRSKSVDRIYHSNTVTTSCSLIQLGGLASRGYVIDRGYPQTPQGSDTIDKKFKLWYDVFTDTVDIHARASTFNFYGPVLFVLDARILKHLPAGSEVLVTKENPIHWRAEHTLADQFFTTREELEQNLFKGDFGKQTVIRTPDGILPFQEYMIEIVVDDPKRKLSNRTDAFDHASSRIETVLGGVSIPITKRQCLPGCGCTERYKTLRSLDNLFK